MTTKWHSQTTEIGVKVVSRDNSKLVSAFCYSYVIILEILSCFVFHGSWIINQNTFCCFFAAGKSFDDQEIEDMMEQGNWSVFTEGVNS